MEKSQEEKLNDIHRAIVGNPEYKQKGLLDRVESLESSGPKNMRRAGIIGGALGVTLATLANKLGLAKAWAFIAQFI